MLQFICERLSGVCDFDLNLFAIRVRIEVRSGFNNCNMFRFMKRFLSIFKNQVHGFC